uniref:Uncharacterized protein n=1 Tax=Cacopsylla melanoneura TaxID=428564 RepID=A0A8D8U916_9HEMI
MDVFGNSSYIPNQSQWSQTGFMPTLNSFTSTNTTNTWSQTPPNNVPWGISYSQALPNVIRFTGQSDVSFPHHNSISSSSSHLQIKRHLDDSDDDSLDSSTVLSKPPAKQFITEEKMAAKMNEMHISNAFTRFYQEPQSQSSYQHSCLLHRSNTNCCTSATTSTLSSSHLQPNATEEDTSFNMMDDTNDNLNNNRSGSNNFNKSSCSNNFNNTPSNNNGQMPSLYLSEELKRLSCSIDPVIPKDLLQRNLNSQARNGNLALASEHSPGLQSPRLRNRVHPSPVKTRPSLYEVTIRRATSSLRKSPNRIIELKKQWLWTICNNRCVCEAKVLELLSH